MSYKVSDRFGSITNTKCCSYSLMDAKIMAINYWFESKKDDGTMVKTMDVVRDNRKLFTIQYVRT